MKSMQQKFTVFGVTYKSKLPEISQQKRSRKLGLVAIHICLPLDFFNSLNLWYLIIPMACLSTTKWNGVSFQWSHWKLISSLGDSNYLKGCLFILNQILFLPASTSWSNSPFWSQTEWPSFLLHGDSPPNTWWQSSASLFICIQHCHLPGKLLYYCIIITFVIIL